MITVLVAILLATTCARSQTVVPPQYFGMHYVKGQPWPTIPFGSLRLWDTDTRWQQMNPVSGVYRFFNSRRIPRAGSCARTIRCCTGSGGHAELDFE